jgi:hypothetical protein
MHVTPKTLDERMERFVADFGRVPPEARRLEDFEARNHEATWIRRLLGQGISCNYVIAYAHESQWWTFCFTREQEQRAEASGQAEVWLVEAYDSTGHSWSDTFAYAPIAGRWYRPRDGLLYLFVPSS